MKIYYIFYFILLLITFSCQNKKETNKDQGKDTLSTTNNNNFSEKINVLNELQLPSVYYCGVDSYKWASDYGRVIENITPSGYGVVGKLPSKLNYEFIIFGKIGDIIYPYLYQYDKNGILVDSFYLHIGYCDADDEIINTSLTTINQDLSINMTDSTKHIHYITNNKYIIDSIVIREKELCLDSLGRYIITKNNVISKE